MRPRQVILTVEMLDDLFSIYCLISEAAGRVTAERYDRRIRVYCRNFDLAGERGTLRNDIRPGLRVVGFEKRVILLFTISEDRVEFLRAFYGGQDWESHFIDD